MKYYIDLGSSTIKTYQCKKRYIKLDRRENYHI